MSNDWLMFAPCAQTDPELFHPEARDRASLAAAKRICGGCDFRAQCLLLAFQRPAHEQYGVYGGLSFTELRAARRAWLEAA